MKNYANVINEMQELDQKRNSENVEVLSVSTTMIDMLNITVRNIGSYQIHFIWLGLFEASSSQEYYEIDFYIDPGETLTDIRNDSISIPIGEERDIQLITEMGNVFSFSIPYTPPGGLGDGSSELASVTIVGIGLPHNPSTWNTLAATTNISGSVLDLVDNDSSYVVFRSYPSGNSSDITDYVDNNASDVDGFADIGSHRSFPAQQLGPDSLFDTLSEQGNVGILNITLINQESFEGAWPPSGWSETGRWNSESNQAYDGTRSADIDGGGGGQSGNLDTPDLDTSDANAIYVDFWYRDELCDDTELLLQYFDGNNWDTIADLSSTTSENQWLQYQDNIADNQYFKSDFKIRWAAVSIDTNEHFYVDLVTIKKETVSQNYELDLEVQWTNVNYSESNEELSIFLDENSDSIDATGGYMIVGDGTPDWGSTSGTISFWLKWDTLSNSPWGQDGDMEMRITVSNLVLDWGGTNSLTSNTNFVSNTWYFIAIVWNENTNDLNLYVGDENSLPTLDASDPAWGRSVSSLGVIENNFMAARNGVNPVDGHGDDLRYWNIDRSLAEIQSDYNTELTGSETNLMSYFKLNNNFDDIGPDDNDGSGVGSYSFSNDVPFGDSTEDLQVDVWYGGSWQNLFTNLTSGWNNASISSYLDSSNFTIRFQGTVESGDSNKNTWDIDVALLHLWTDSDRYTAEVEFTGTSNLEVWTELIWRVDSSWDIGDVSVTIQIYDYQLGVYATSGGGYLSYISDSSPGTDELKTQTITMNSTNFRNSTSHWRVKIKGEATTPAAFQVNIDWIDLRSIYSSAGENIQYDVWYEYKIDAITADGDPISYGIVSIYGNGSSLSFRNAVTQTPITNPDWVYLDVDGEYYLEVKSIHGASEIFYLRTVVGSVIGEKTITQEAP
jgi:hypothetical protein